MFLLYKNKSTNSLSLTFCALNIISSGMWIYYSSQLHDIPMILRSSAEISLLSISVIYIIRNKIKANTQISDVNHGSLKNGDNIHIDIKQ